MDTAGCRSFRRLEYRGREADGADGDADAATGARADDVVGGVAQQADRLPAWRLGSDSEGPRLGDSAKAGSGEPHAGGDRRRQDRSRPMAAKRDGGNLN